MVKKILEIQKMNQNLYFVEKQNFIIELSLCLEMSSKQKLAYYLMV